ncbi:Wadjet anti-phage system protein JetD domain-containing protein [Kitasatospora sp. NPDC057223]|uniref:Wadjet anti-phage system protein JetD domain-containing protein n=1 Tax=Kitasatospora sp. NPDC057223 TaxID=3346055 RepID=UPI00363020B9
MTTMTSTDSPEGLSSRAADLLDRLRAHALGNGWQGTTQRRMPIADVLSAFKHLTVPPGREGDLPRRILSDHLSELAHAKQITFSAATDRERTPLPLKVVLLPFRSTVRRIQPMPAWHSSLSWAEDYWAQPRTTDKIRAAYEALNSWLHRGQPGLRLPVRERALKIFGRHPYFQQPEHPAEKIFDRLKAKPLFSDYPELLIRINAFHVDPPLLTGAFDTVPLEEDSGYHRLGRGRGLLVIENSTTYWSISHMLQHIDHGLGYIAWGIGNTFPASIGSIGPRDEISHVVYFGDLDAAGLRIPISALQRRLPGLPSVRPAVGLYDALLRHGHPGLVKPKEARISIAEAHRLAAWLHPRHRPQAVGLLLRGERLAQEWVSLDHLSTETHWYSDVR